MMPFRDPVCVGDGLDLYVWTVEGRWLSVLFHNYEAIAAFEGTTREGIANVVAVLAEIALDSDASFTLEMVQNETDAHRLARERCRFEVDARLRRAAQASERDASDKGTDVN